MANINKISLPNGEVFDIEDAVARGLGVSDLSDTTITNPADGQTLTYDATTGKWVNATSDAGFDVQIVQTLPTTNIDTHTIYFILASATIGAGTVGTATVGGSDDVYDEYMYINNAWEKIGSTRLDLSDYAKKSEIPAQVQSNWDENDSTALSYVQNRTHYRESIGYEIVLSHTFETQYYSYGYDFTDINKEYSYVNTGGYLSLIELFQSESYFPTCSLSDFDLTAESVLAKINGVDTELTVEYVPDSEYWGESVIYIYNNDICFVIGEDDGYLWIQFYSVNSNQDEIDLPIPMANEIFNYSKLLDSNYLDGKLITKGTGERSEIFNSPLNISSGRFSHAEGEQTVASGYSSHSEGVFTESSGSYSHSEGAETISSGSASHSEGGNTISSGGNSHAEGYYTTASSTGSHSEGQGTSFSIRLTGAANTTTYTVTSTYRWSSPFDHLKLCRIGSINILSGTITNGILTDITLSETLNAESAVNNRYYTINKPVVASGYASHAEGYGTYASGNVSHAEGANTVASGYYSHSEGESTIAQRRANHVFGEYNLADTGGTGIDTKGNYIEIVGNGTADATRSNARTLDWSGNEVLAGKLTVGAGPVNNMDVATKQYVDQNAGGNATIAIANNVITLTNASGQTSSITLPVYSGAVSGGAS